MARQWLIPGVGYVEEAEDGRQWLVGNGAYINEAAPAAGGSASEGTLDATIGDVTLSAEGSLAIEGTLGEAAEVVTWNPDDKSPSITLSNGDLTVTSAATTNESVRATLGRSTGKFYVELTIDATGSGSRYLGLANASADLTDSRLGEDANSIGVTGSLIRYNAATIGTTLSTQLPGTVKRFAVDLDAALLWFTTDTEDWNSDATADPETGVGGLDISGLVTGVDIFPCASLGGTATDKQSTVNLGASAFTYSAPAGFAAWGGTGAPAGATLDDVTLTATATFGTQEPASEGALNATIDDITLTATATMPQATAVGGAGHGAVGGGPRRRKRREEGKVAVFGAKGRSGGLGDGGGAPLEDDPEEAAPAEAAAAPVLLHRPPLSEITVPEPLPESALQPVREIDEASAMVAMERERAEAEAARRRRNRLTMALLLAS